MKTRIMTAAVALIGAAGLGIPANAQLAQFALVGGTALKYTYNAADPALSVLSTPVGGANETLTFPVGSQTATLFPNGIAVNVKITGDYTGALIYQPTLTQPAGSNPSNPTWLEWARNFDDVSVTVTYAGSGNVLSANNSVLLTPGETVFTLSDVLASMTGDSQNPTVSGSHAAPAGVTLSFDDQSPPSSGDYSDGTGNFFDFTPGGDTVAEDSFTFVDSSARAVLACNGACPASYSPSGEFHLRTQHFSPNGNFSADAEPTVTGVPEPASWALMILGVGAVGGVLRRRRAMAPACA